MAPSLDPALPYLEELVADFKELCSLAKDCMPDPNEQAGFASLEADLSKFQKILQKEKEYTRDQVEQLAKDINAVAERMSHLTDKKEIEKGIREKFALMNGGRDPINSINIEVDFSPAFAKKMHAIEELCKKIEKDVKQLEKQASGRQFSYLKKLTTACLKAMKIVRKQAATLLHEITYYGNRAAILVGLKNRTPADKKEYWERQEKHAQKKGREADAEALGEAMLQQKTRDGKRPRIF